MIWLNEWIEEYQSSSSGGLGPENSALFVNFGSYIVIAVFILTWFIFPNEEFTFPNNYQKILAGEKFLPQWGSHAWLIKQEEHIQRESQQVLER